MIQWLYLVLGERNETIIPMFTSFGRNDRQ